jgi:hypothetical protein
MSLRLEKYLVGLVVVSLAGLSYGKDNQSVALEGRQALNIPSLAVKKRLEAIEQINVTAQKEPEPVNDAELQAILDEAAVFEGQAPMGEDAS